MILEKQREYILTATDRCDADCSAQAYIVVKGVSGELMFCSHHYNKINNNPSAKQKLDNFAFEVIDETEKLIENRLVGEN
jgi:hypothetical protein